MPKVKADEVQVNYIMPRALDERVKDYQFERRLASKAEAYRELITKGLEAAEAEKRAPKS